MKAPGLKFLWKITRELLDILRKETKSTAGVTNLLGGIVISVFILSLFAQNLLIQLFNMLLALLEKPLMPQVGGFYTILSILFLVVYFMFCVKVIAQSES